MEEMSDCFLANGQELTMEEWRETRRRNRMREAERKFGKCEKSFFWLGHALALPHDFDLKSVLLQIELEGSAAFYDGPTRISKKGGGTRFLFSPKPHLKLVQQRIHRLLKEKFVRAEHVFGYRGGTCLQVAERHRSWPSTLKFDVKDAFFQVSWTKVKRAIRWSGDFSDEPGFSGIVSHWIAKLCTYSLPPGEKCQLFLGASSFLPQGAPTSPICFDLACASLDKKLARIAERVGGIVSRYADNYYFSMPTSRISAKLERMIMCDVQRYFPIHKVRRVDQGELCRILGYNLESGNLTNTRTFRRTLRGALYVLRTRLERGLDWGDAYARVKGCMGFAQNLPTDLEQVYEECESRIADL